jgi:hypothetical protein
MLSRYWALLLNKQKRNVFATLAEVLAAIRCSSAVNGRTQTEHSENYDNASRNTGETLCLCGAPRSAKFIVYSTLCDRS